jgi:hypothetical protein
MDQGERRLAMTVPARRLVRHHEGQDAAALRRSLTWSPGEADGDSRTDRHDRSGSEKFRQVHDLSSF